MCRIIFLDMISELCMTKDDVDTYIIIISVIQPAGN